MKFKVGDLITGTDKALSNFQDIDLSDQAVLEVTEVDDDEYYCIIISNQIDDSNVGETVTFYDSDERFFVHITPEVSTKYHVDLGTFSVNEFKKHQENTSSGLSRAKLLKAKGLL